MGFETDYFARQAGRTNAAAASGTSQPNWLAGFAGSTLSSFGELFGAQPSQTAVQFREANPFAGFGSELLGGAILPYGAMGRLAATARGVALTDSAMAAIPGVRALTAEANPILHGAARLAVQFSPLELARLGVGLTTSTDAHDYGNLMADVGLSTLLTGGFGALGGFFRAGGRAALRPGNIVGQDIGFAPTFALRMARAPEAQVTGEVALPDMRNDLMRQVFTERPQALPGTTGGQYVEALEGGTPESAGLVNAMFKPSSRRSSGSFLRQPFMGQDGLWAVDEATRTEVVAGAGFTDIEDLASTLRHPRLVTIGSDRAAGTFAKLLEDSPALQYVGEGALIAREPNQGLWVVAKRLREGGSDPLSAASVALERAGRELDPVAAEAVRGRSHGPMRIGEGDRWLIGLTDQPGRLIPEAHRVAELNVEQWAKQAGGFRPSTSPDLFNQNANVLNEVMTPRDFRDLRYETKGTMIGRITERVASKFSDVSGLKGSATFRDWAEAIYGAVKPARFLENQSPLYQRLWAHLEYAMSTARTVTRQIVGGDIRVVGNPNFAKNLEAGSGFAGQRAEAAIWADLSDEERRLVYNAARTRTPAEALDQLTADGLVSAKATAAVRELQALNNSVWEQAVLPAFKAGGVDMGTFDLLKGYIAPRVFRGDWFVPVLDEAGRTKWLASGNIRAAKREAQTVVDTAAEAGHKWTLGDGRASHISQKDISELDKLSDMVGEAIGRDADTQDILQKAVRKLELARIQARRPLGELRRLGNPQTLKERSGLPGTPDIEEHTLDDILRASESHWRTLLNFAAYHTWRERWLPEALKLRALEPRMFEDLHRKANQFVGVPSAATKVMNQTLTPLFGHLMGGRAAEKIASGANGLLYAWNIGIANPAHALQNLMNPLQTVAPWIAFMTSKAPSLAKEKLMQVAFRFDETGRVAGRFNALHPMKVLGQAMREMRAPDEALAAGYQRALATGDILPKLYEGWVGGDRLVKQTLTDSYNAAGGGMAGGWAFIKRSATLMAEKSEEFSRVTAFTSAWILGRDAFNLEGDALFKFAQRGTQVTMYGYSVVDRPRIITGPLGSVFGLFKNWQMNYIGDMAQYAGIGMQHGVWSPMLWQFGATLALAGIGGTPLKMVADGLAKWNDDSPSSFLWMQEHWHHSADELYFGLPALFGVSLRSSLTTPGTDVRNDLSNLSNIVLWERMKAMGKAVGAAWNYSGGTDENALRNPNIRDQLLQAFAPRAIFRAYSAMEGDYIRSMSTGYPQVRGVSGTTQLLHGIGLNTLEVDRQQTAATELWNNEEQQRGQIAALGMEFADAELRDDRDAMTEIAQRTIALGLPQSSVLQSAQTRMRREQESDSLSRFGAEDRARYMAALGH